MKESLRKILALFLVAVLCISCDSTAAFAKKAKKVKVTSVQCIKPEFGTITMKKGSTYQIKCKVKPAGASNKKLVYKSSKPKIVKVSKKGKLTALRKGKAVITVRSRSNKKKQKKIKVIVGTPVRKVTAVEKKIEIKKGETKDISNLYNITPKSASNKNVVFTSNNKAVASVTKKGKLTANSDGECKIKIMAKDGSSKYASITVKVYSRFRPAETLEDADSSIELFTSDDQMLITAYGEYDSVSDSVLISWSSLTKTGTFTVQRQVSSEYIDLVTVTDTDSYIYRLSGYEQEQLVFRILQQTDNGTAASNDVVMEYNGAGADKFLFAAKDSDNDGLYDYIENQLKTDPYSADTDGDKLSDYAEYMMIGTDPLLADTDLNGISDGDEDFDNDGLSNAEEMEWGTSVVSEDTDGDGLTDKKEVSLGTDSLNEDTDGDGLNDYLETVFGTDPLSVDTNGNGISDGDENYTYHCSSQDMGDAVQAEIMLSAQGEQLSTFSIQPLGEDAYLGKDLPGYLGTAYNLEMEGSFNVAQLTMSYQGNVYGMEHFEPAIYYYNEETDTLEYVQGQYIQGNTVTAPLAHFSSYVLLNKFTVDDVWNTEIRRNDQIQQEHSSVDIVFVIDRSGSMSSNDRNGNRKKVVSEFINASSDGDRMAVVTYNTKATILPSDAAFAVTKEEKEALVSEINYSANGNTDSTLGLQNALDILINNRRDDADSRNIILLTDGKDTHKSYPYDTIIENAVQNGIKIYTIGLGSGIDADRLMELAVKTGAQYYYATNADELFEQFGNVAADIDLVTDTDGDGLCDYYEMHFRTSTGKYLKLDPNNRDTDGDGLSDFEEVESIVTDGDKLLYFKLKSDPSLADTDGDEIWDAEDSEPLLAWHPRTGLSQIVYNAGFNYLDGKEKDIIYSRYQAGQRDFGFCYAYDEAIVAIDSILDCEPIYFIYDGKEWMIELWKGQYGIETGGEVGVYYRDFNGPAFSQRLRSNKEKMISSLSQQFMQSMPGLVRDIITAQLDTMIEDVIGNYDTIDSVSNISKIADNTCKVLHSHLSGLNIPFVDEFIDASDQTVQAAVNLIQSLNSKMYDCVKDEDMPEIAFTLMDRENNKIFSRGIQPHWWLTGFRWGELNEPKNLKMDITIKFKDSDMKNAFLYGGSVNFNPKIDLTDRNNDNNGEYGLLNIRNANGASVNSYANIVKNNGDSVEFTFDKPLSAQPYNQTLLYPLIKASVTALTLTYNGFKYVIGCNSNDPNEIDAKVEKCLQTIDNGIESAKRELYDAMCSNSYIYDILNAAYKKLHPIQSIWSDLPRSYNKYSDECMQKGFRDYYTTVEDAIAKATNSLYTVANAAVSPD